MGHGIARGPAERQAQDKQYEQAEGKYEPYPAQDVVAAGNGIRSSAGEVGCHGFDRHRLDCAFCAPSPEEPMKAENSLLATKKLEV
jgi:hypothetical protein